MRKPAPLLLPLVMVLCISCNRSDERVARNIEKKASADPEIQISQLVIVARDGKVTLKGRASSALSRERLEDIAKTEPGVWTVDDQVIADTREELARTAPPSTPRSHVPLATAAVSKVVVVPSGTVIAIRTKQTLASRTSHAGAPFKGALAKPVSVRGNIIIPSGASVDGTVKEVRQPGLVTGGAVLVLGLEAITIRGRTYELVTEPLEKEKRGGAKRGSASQDKHFNLPADSALSFRLARPLKVSAMVTR